jgi:hypothetical protein
MIKKTTTELLNLLTTLVEKDGRLKKGWEEALEELENRTPFFEILNQNHDQSLPVLLDKIEVLENEIERLKNHKHDYLTGDAVIKI